MGQYKVTNYKIRIVTDAKLQEDIDIIMSNIDDLSAAALNLSNGGPMAYSQFIQLRDNFRGHYQKIRDDYKPVDILL